MNPIRSIPSGRASPTQSPPSGNLIWPSRFRKDRSLNLVESMTNLPACVKAKRKNIMMQITAMRKKIEVYRKVLSRIAPAVVCTIS